MRAKVGAGASMGATDIRQLPPALRDNRAERVKVAARKRVIQAELVYERAKEGAMDAAKRVADALAEVEAARAKLAE